MRFGLLFPAQLLYISSEARKIYVQIHLLSNLRLCQWVFVLNIDHLNAFTLRDRCGAVIVRLSFKLRPAGVAISLLIRAGGSKLKGIESRVALWLLLLLFRHGAKS